MALKKIPRKRYSPGRCGSYNYQCDIVHRDNKDILNYKSGGSSGYRMRVPSLKRPISTWKRFYKLFPSVLKHLKQGDLYQNQIEKDGVIIVQNYRIHGNYARNRTIKFKKIW